MGRGGGGRGLCLGAGEVKNSGKGGILVGEYIIFINKLVNFGKAIL